MPRKKQNQEPNNAVKDDPKLEAWTVDIRNTHGDKVTEQDLSEITKNLESRGRKLAKLYCTDKQRESIEKIKGYEDVELMK